jgi:anti-sigma factor RsiW
MDCPRFHELLDDYLADRLDELDRSAFRAHLRSCDACRAAVSVIEPTLLFATLPEARVTEREIEDCVTAVSARIRQDRLERRLAPRRRAPWLAAAASIIVLLGAGVLWRSGTPAPGGSAVPTPGIAAAENAPPPRVEIESGSAGMRVYQYAGGAGDNTAAVFIVDEGLEL